MTTHSGPASHDDTRPWQSTMGQPAMMTQGHDSPQWASHDDTRPWQSTMGQPAMMTQGHDSPQWASHDDTRPWQSTMGQTAMMTHSRDYPQWASHDDTQPWLPTVGQTAMTTHSHDYPQWARQPWWHTAMTTHSGGQPAMMTHSHDYPQWASQPWWHTAMTTHSGPASHDDTQPWLPTMGQTAMMTHSHDYPQWASQPWWHTAMTTHNGPEPWWHTAVTQPQHHTAVMSIPPWHHTASQKTMSIKSTEVKETTNSTHRKQLGIRSCRVWSSSGCDAGTFLKTTARDMFLSGAHQQTPAADRGAMFWTDLWPFSLLQPQSVFFTPLQKETHGSCTAHCCRLSDSLLAGDCRKVNQRHTQHSRSPLLRPPWKSSNWSFKGCWGEGGGRGGGGGEGGGRIYSCSCMCKKAGGKWSIETGGLWLWWLFTTYVEKSWRGKAPSWRVASDWGGLSCHNYVEKGWRENSSS